MSSRCPHRKITPHSNDMINPLQNKKKVRIRFYPMIPNFRDSTCFWKVPRFRPFVLLVRGAHG